MLHIEWLFSFKFFYHECGLYSLGDGVCGFESDAEGRHFDGREMVLRGAVGGGEAEHEVGFDEEEAFGSVPVLLLHVGDGILPRGESAAEAARGVPLEILVLFRTRRPIARYKLFMFF